MMLSSPIRSTIELVVETLDQEGQPADPALDGDELEAREAVEQPAHHQVGEADEIAHLRQRRQRREGTSGREVAPQAGGPSRADVEVHGQAA